MCGGTGVKPYRQTLPLCTMLFFKGRGGITYAVYINSRCDTLPLLHNLEQGLKLIKVLPLINNKLIIN